MSACKDCCEGSGALALTTSQGEACMQQVNLSLILLDMDKTTKVMRGEHRVVLYADTCAHPLLVRHVHMIGDRKWVEATFEFQVKPTQPSMLIVQWFSEVCVNDVWALELIASGSTCADTWKSPVSGQYNIGLIDIARAHVATLTIQGVPWLLATSNNENHKAAAATRNVGADALIAQVRKAYMKSPADLHRLSDIDVHIGTVATVPAVWFTLHAMQLKFERSVAVSYFARCIELVKSISPTVVDPHQLLADVLALPSLGWIYRTDRSYHSNMEVDTWTSLWNYPLGAPCAFDCEDGSKALLEMVIALQRLADADDNGSEDSQSVQQHDMEVYKLARIACRYVGWLAIGDVRTDLANGDAASTKYTPHCYVILEPLFPTDPYLTLESTIWASGVWKQGSETDDSTDMRTFLRTKEWARTHLTTRAERKHARVRVPMSVVRRRRLYGRITAMFSSRVPNKFDTMSTQHRLVGGIEAEDLFMRRKKPHEIMAINETNNTLKAVMQRELALAPVCLFPVADDSRTTKHASTMIVVPATCCARAYPTVKLTSQIELAVVLQTK